MLTADLKQRGFPEGVRNIALVIHQASPNSLASVASDVIDEIRDILLFRSLTNKGYELTHRAVDAKGDVPSIRQMTD